MESTSMCRPLVRWLREATGVGRASCLALLLGLSVFVLAACGEDDDAASTAAPTATAKGDPATGSPVTLGLLDIGNQPEFSDGVKTAVEYLNEEGGGLAGHRIELHSCRAGDGPQQSISCANEFVREDAVAVIIGEDLSGDSAFPVYERAKLPVISGRPNTNQFLVNPVAISLGPGPVGTLAALGEYASTNFNAENAITLSAPAPEDVLDQLVAGPLKAAGIEDTQYVFYDPEKPNFDTTAAAAASKEPDMVLVDNLGNRQCGPMMRALKSAGGDFKVFHVACGSQAVLDAVGSLADGQIFYGPLDSVTGADTPDVDLYEQILATYGSSDSGDGLDAATAVSSVITLARVLDEQEVEAVTGASILSAFDGAQGVNVFMGPPVECGAAKAFPRLCALGVRFFTVEDGERKLLTEEYVSAAAGLSDS